MPAPSIIITLTLLSASNFFNAFNKSVRFLNDNELYVFGSLISIDEISLVSFNKFDDDSQIDMKFLIESGFLKKKDQK